MDSQNYEFITTGVSILSKTIHRGNNTVVGCSKRPPLRISFLELVLSFTELGEHLDWACIGHADGGPYFGINGPQKGIGQTLFPDGRWHRGSACFPSFPNFRQPPPDGLVVGLDGQCKFEILDYIFMAAIYQRIRW